jgi:pilus assembly protein Flp/PilA
MVRVVINHLQIIVKDDYGATTVEYGLLIALIAAVIFWAAQGLGGTVNTLFTNFNSDFSVAYDK